MNLERSEYMSELDSCVLKMEEISLFTVGTGNFYADLTLLKGRCYACIGKKDSGKTTLLKIIADLEPVYMGSLTLFGKSDSAGLMESRERVGAYIDRTVGYRALSFAANFRAQRIAVGRKRGGNMSEVFNKLDFTSRNTDRRRLSAQTTQQRLIYGIAAAFLNNPELLLLDEPFTGLDRDKRVGLAELLISRCQNGMTALVTFHNLEEACSTGIFTDYIFLSEGRVVKQLSSEELNEMSENLNCEHAWDTIEQNIEAIRL
jgi:ABC-type multidrug transport system ATPase subunit